MPYCSTKVSPHPVRVLRTTLQHGVLVKPDNGDKELYKDRRKPLNPVFLISWKNLHRIFFPKQNYVLNIFTNTRSKLSQFFFYIFRHFIGFICCFFYIVNYLISTTNLHFSLFFLSYCSQRNKFYKSNYTI